MEARHGGDVDSPTGCFPITKPMRPVWWVLGALPALIRRIPGAIALPTSSESRLPACKPITGPVMNAERA